MFWKNCVFSLLKVCVANKTIETKMLKNCELVLMVEFFYLVDQTPQQKLLSLKVGQILKFDQTHPVIKIKLRFKFSIDKFQRFVYQLSSLTHNKTFTSFIASKSNRGKYFLVM